MRPDTHYKDLTNAELRKLLVEKYGESFTLKDFEDGELETKFARRIAQSGGGDAIPIYIMEYFEEMCIPYLDTKANEETGMLMLKEDSPEELKKAYEKIVEWKKTGRLPKY